MNRGVNCFLASERHEQTSRSPRGDVNSTAPYRGPIWRVRCRTVVEPLLGREIIKLQARDRDYPVTLDLLA